VGAVQFVNILDFVIVMPLGPDFAAALGISTSHIGVIGGSYTASAAVAGVVGSLFLDRFDRRAALGVAMLGLMLGTAAGGLATGLWSLLGARLLAGAFGGPATSIALAMIADTVPLERRGKAMGAVMGAFAAASVLGVPAGLELARLVSWRAPFFAVAALSLLVTSGVLLRLPPMVGHRARAAEQSSKPRVPLLDSLTLRSLAGTALTALGVFAIVPNLSTYVQHNLGYPREHLGILYMVGGVASFIATRLVGTLVDRYGATLLVSIGTIIFAGTCLWGFVWTGAPVPVLPFFVLFMLSGSVRNVPLQTLASRVPRQEQRARFMSAQSATQHMASAAGASLSSLFLTAAPDGRLIDMNRLALAAAGVALLVPWVARSVERRVRARERSAAEAAASAPATPARAAAN
jgi:predicted MFS family arabinose efflux permease